MYVYMSYGYIYVMASTLLGLELFELSRSSLALTVMASLCCLALSSNVCFLRSNLIS